MVNLLNHFMNFKISIRNSSALSRLKTHLDEQLEGIKTAGTFKNERVITSKQGSYIKGLFS